MKQQKEKPTLSINGEVAPKAAGGQVALLSPKTVAPLATEAIDLPVRRSKARAGKRLEEDEQALTDGEGVVMSDVTGTVVAQLDSVLAAGSNLGAASAPAASAGLTAAGVSGTAAGATSASALAATSATVVTTTTVTTATTVSGVSSLASVAGGAVALGATVGGAGSSATPSVPLPVLPPANPFPGDPGSDPGTLDLGGVSGANNTDSRAVHRIFIAGTGLPGTILNKSLVVDLGADAGPLQGKLFYTEKSGALVTTQVVIYRDINNVKGSAVNDQISGHADANILDGGAGDDIMYGGGGLDQLLGGAGQDWVLFRPLTRGGGAGPYDDGVYLNLAGTDGSLSGVVGFYRSASQTLGAAAQASGFEHAVGSMGADALMGTDNSNILVGSDGDDWMEGAAGDDHLVGGASLVTGNQLSGGTGKDVFWAGYDFNPVLRALEIAGTTESLSASLAFNPLADSTAVSELVNTSVVRDWDASNDGLRVSTSATLVIGGLTGNSPWSADNSVDLRTKLANLGVENLGTIKVAAGAGTNQIYTTSGVEQLWVGYNYAADQSGAVYGQGANTVINGLTPPALTGNTADVIWGWDDQTMRRDALYVGAGSKAIVGSLLGMDPSSTTRWNGADTVDLRGPKVVNSGSVVISSGAGNNILYGSGGQDVVYGSSEAGSFNQVWGDAGSDVFYVGTQLNAATGSTSVMVSKDLFWDFSLTNDTLNISNQGTAVLALLDGLTDWNADNTVNLSGITANAGTIIVALGAGNDRFVGSAGVDVVYGGTSTLNGNQLSGGAGADQFFVGTNYSPLAGALNDAAGRTELVVGEAGLDVIHDWENGVDGLTIGSRGVAVMGGLAGKANWDGTDTINVSAASNQGLIKLAAGAGNNNLYLSAGVEQLWSGYQFTRAGTSAANYSINGFADPTVLTSSVDVLWGWDDNTTRRDQLNISTQGRAVIASLLGMDAASAARWNGNDVLDLRTQVNNAGLLDIATGAGSNTLYASGGNDHFHVGYIANTDGTFVTSSAAIDAIYGWNARAWSNLPFAGTFSSSANWNGTEAADTNYDRLTVATGSMARIVSLDGSNPSDATRWDGSQTMDLRGSGVSNLNSTSADGGGIEIWTGSGNDYIYGSAGRDYIYSGAGLDNVWGGGGKDAFYVGYSPSWAAFGAYAAEPRIWDWQNGSSDANPGDGLRIASGSYAVIAGLWGMDPTNATRWSGHDTVDLRWDVQNYGKVIIESSDGNDSVYGSSGVDWINPGAGRNDLDLRNGGADRVYLDNFLTRTQVQGFGSDDRIYLDTRVLQSFINQRGITTPSAYNIGATSTQTTSSISAGQYYDNGSYIVSELTYDATYNGTLQAYNANPKDPDFNVYGGMANGILKFGWSTNGAWNNLAYDTAYLNGKIAVIGSGSSSIAIGSSLAGIPFIGPILAIPFWVNGGLMLNDGINNVHTYQNPVYDGGVLARGASTVSKGVNVSSAVGDWNAPNFLDFYGVNGSGGFVPSLEIAGQQPGYTEIPSSISFLPYTFYQAPALTGVASYLAIYNGVETFIYLVASRDALIQNNETILIAQVNGQVTADQLVMYNGGTDTEYLRYFDNTVQAPVFPPNPSMDATSITASANNGKQVLYRVSYTQNGTDLVDYVTQVAYSTLLSNSQGTSPSVTNLSLQGAYTNENTIAVSIAFDKALVETDVLKLYIGGAQIGSSLSGLSGTTWSGTLDISGVADRANVITAVMTSEQGFQSQGAVSFVRDTTAPNITDSNTNMVLVTDTASSIIVTSNEPGFAKLGGTAVKLTDAGGNQATFTLTAQGSTITQALTVEDIFGLSTALGSVTLGTAGVDNLSSTSQFVYGFGGNDTLSSSFVGANSQAASLYGGAGDDTLIGTTNLNNTFVGGAGQDVLDLRGGNNTLVWNLVASASDSVPTSSDSNAAATDYVYGFRVGHDGVTVVATGVQSVDMTTLLHTISDPYLNGPAAFTQLGISLDGSAGAVGTGDLLLEFSGTFSSADLASALRFNLTGTSAADTLRGAVNADTFKGGAGADTFVFAAGDSTPTVSGTTVQGYDVITDMQVGMDILDLAGLAVTPADGAFDGIDFGGIMSHSVVKGLLTFAGAGGNLDVNAFTLKDALAYLQANITVDLQTVVFQQAGDSYVFQNTSTDLLLQLSGVTSVMGLTDTAHPVANYLFIS